MIHNYDGIEPQPLVDPGYTEWSSTIDGFSQGLTDQTFEADGWPWRCVWHVRRRFVHRLGLPNPQARSDVMGLIWFATPLAANRRGHGPYMRSDESVFLAYNPIWSGLIGNSVVYGGVWFVALVGGGYLRRVRRVRRGRCPMCRYDIASDVWGGCSECGWGRESES